MANRTKRTPEKEQQFLDALAETGNVSIACLEAGLGRRTVYEWKEADPDFAELWDDHLDQGIAKLELECLRRARDGVEEDVYQGGHLVGTRKRYSDTLAIFLLKAHKPDVYRERVEVSGKLETRPDLSELNETELEQFESLLARTVAASAGGGET